MTTTPEAPTFNKGDYLAIGPYCWARSDKSADAALKRCKKEFPFPKDTIKKGHFKVFQLADQVDKTEVSDLGVVFFHKGTDSTIPTELVPNYAILVMEIKPEKE